MSDQELIPCPHQHKETWACKWGIVKPVGKCKPVSQKHRAIEYDPGRMKRSYKASFQCLILPVKRCQCHSCIDPDSGRGGY